MTDRREEENIREEIRRSQAAPRRGSGLKRVLMVLLVLIAVLAVVVAAAWKDLSSLDSVRRLFSYNKVTQDEQGKVEMYSFSNDRSNTFALLGSVVRTLVFVLCFLVLTLLLRLVTGGIDKVLDLPVLNALNTIGGGALGLIEGALLLFLVCDVAPKLGVKAFADYEGTYLLSFFMSHTPRGLVAALLP